MKKVLNLDTLFKKYDVAREQAKLAEAEKTELSNEIKTTLEAKKLDKVDGVQYLCTYIYDKDKSTEIFDEELFAAKEPKKYADYCQFQEDMKRLAKKYTKVVVSKGARKLVVTRKNMEEEC